VIAEDFDERIAFSIFEGRVSFHVSFHAIEVDRLLRERLWTLHAGRISSRALPAYVYSTQSGIEAQYTAIGPLPPDNVSRLPH